MITLYLVKKRILKKPILYLSDFGRNRTLYYDNLMRVREKNNIDQWFKFSFVGVMETARSSITTFAQILKLKDEIEIKLKQLGSRSKNAQTIVNELYPKPLLDAQKPKN